MFAPYKQNNLFETMVCCGYVRFKNKLPKVTFNNKNGIFDSEILNKSLLGVFGHSILGKTIPSDLIKDLTIDSKHGFDNAQLVPELCKRVKRVIYIGTTIYYYRQMSGSIIPHFLGSIINTMQKRELQPLSRASCN